MAAAGIFKWQRRALSKMRNPSFLGTAISQPVKSYCDWAAREHTSQFREHRHDMNTFQHAQGTGLVIN